MVAISHLDKLEREIDPQRVLYYRELAAKEIEEKKKMKFPPPPLPVYILLLLYLVVFNLFLFLLLYILILVLVVVVVLFFLIPFLIINYYNIIILLVKRKNHMS